MVVDGDLPTQLPPAPLGRADGDLPLRSARVTPRLVEQAVQRPDGARHRDLLRALPGQCLGGRECGAGEQDRGQGREPPHVYPRRDGDLMHGRLSLLRRAGKRRPGTASATAIPGPDSAAMGAICIAATAPAQSVHQGVRQETPLWRLLAGPTIWSQVQLPKWPMATCPSEKRLLFWPLCQQVCPVLFL